MSSVPMRAPRVAFLNDLQPLNADTTSTYAEGVCERGLCRSLERRCGTKLDALYALVVCKIEIFGSVRLRTSLNDITSPPSQFDASSCSKPCLHSPRYNNIDTFGALSEMRLLSKNTQIHLDYCLAEYLIKSSCITRYSPNLTIG